MYKSTEIPVQRSRECQREALGYRTIRGNQVTYYGFCLDISSIVWPETSAG